MLAEAIHSFADCGNQGLLLLRHARSPARAQPGASPRLWKVVYFWAFLVAVLLFTVGGAFSIYEGAHKLSDPQPLSWPGVAIAVLAIAVVLESFSLAGCVREIRKVAHGRSLWQFFRQSRNSELIVVLGEDIAALAGLVVALGAVSLSSADRQSGVRCGGQHRGRRDADRGRGVAGHRDQGADHRPERRPRGREGRSGASLANRPEVAELFNLITLQLGDEILLAVKARMRESQDARRLIDDVNRVEADVRRAFPQIQWLFFEPDDRP